MTTVITPVGTSLFTNGGEDNTIIRDLYQTIKDLPAADWNDHEGQIEILRTESKGFIDDAGEIASAELQSTHAIKSRLETIRVHLIASDTITSRLAAEILTEKLPDILHRVQVEFNGGTDVIQGLRATDPNAFETTGAHNLIGRLNQIKDIPQNNQNLAINITGGYAATVSLLTLFAKGNEIPLYYNFEETPDLIEILRYFS